MARIKPTSAVYAAHVVMLACVFGFAVYSGFLFDVRWEMLMLLVPMNAAIIGLIVLVMYHQRWFDERFVRLRGTAWIAGLNALASVLVCVFGLTLSSGPTLWNTVPANQMIEGITVMSLIAIVAAYFFTLLIQGLYHRADGKTIRRHEA